MNMKTKITSGFAILILCAALSAKAQTVTLAVNAQNPSSAYNLSTNQIVKIISITAQPALLNLNPLTINLFHSSGVSVSTTNTGTFTGLTNISVSAAFTISGQNLNVYPGLVTVEILTPCTANVISNYVPADAIVIPASATGNVQIILESSPDLVNWTAASPGTYGAAAGTNRFFRVRAAVSP